MIKPNKRTLAVAYVACLLAGIGIGNYVGSYFKAQSHQQTIESFSTESQSGLEGRTK